MLVLCILLKRLAPNDTSLYANNLEFARLQQQVQRLQLQNTELRQRLQHAEQVDNSKSLKLEP